jgi:hypothetical protein
MVDKNVKPFWIVLVEVVPVFVSSVEDPVNIEVTFMLSAVFVDDNDERMEVDNSLIPVLRETNGAAVVFKNVTNEFVFEPVAVGNEPDVELIVLLISAVAKVLSIPELDGLAL